jgi:hypothetical protein
MIDLDDGDLGIEIKLGLDCINSIEQTNRYRAMSPKRARRAGIEPGRPILSILNQFVAEKIDAVIHKDRMEAMRSARELKWVLRSLVYGVKHPEFKPDLERLEAIMNRIGRTALEQLVHDFLNATRPEKVEECRQLLVELIKEGYWPNWREEYQAICDKRCAALAKKAS